MPGASPGAVVDNDGGQVVEAGPAARQPSPREVLEQVARHVESVERELYVIVQLGAGVGGPPESFDVQAQHVGQPADQELFGGGLLGLAGVAEEALRVGQLLRLDKLVEAVVDVAGLVLPLPHGTLHINQKSIQGLLAKKSIICNFTKKQ